jgi:SAM-dependent methyltransferase
LSYPDNSFDIVFSMSVVEHIEGSEGDTQAIREMARVLRPGGILAVSVPFGERYQEQEIVGVRAAADRMKDGKPYFFQRIYSRGAVENRILAAAPSLRLQSSVSIARRFWTLQRLQARLGTVRIALGFLFPVLSSLTNSSQLGIIPPRGSYGPLFRGDESYGDLVLVWQKSAGRECNEVSARGAEV